METFLSTVQEAEKREALNRVLASPAFRRSDQLKSLLRYICEIEISGHGGSLDEYRVAVEGLGRAKDYSAVGDGAVRNRIHALRRRLEQYYESADEPVRIVLAKGTYCPAFERNLVRPAESPVGEPAPRRPVPARLWRQPLTLGAACALCAVTLVLASAVLLYVGHDRVPVIVREAWGSLLDSDAFPLICIATQPQLSLSQLPFSNPNEPNVAVSDLRKYLEILGVPPGDPRYLKRSLNSPFWGDVAGALTVGNVLARAGVTPEILPESAVEMPALNKRNVLMFGRPSYSRAIDFYLRDKPFRIPATNEEQPPAIRNMNPRPGEPVEFKPSAAAPQRATPSAAFGLITVMIGGDGKSRIVVFSGSLAAGAQAAAEFFSSPKHLQELLRLFEREHISGFPASYQVVVQATIYGTSALDVHYLTHRVISTRN
ncbi:MAG: hypothetical protein ABSH49_04335 [Bryobacteraceae bacterium]|jgi:hypothetical protein